MISDLFSATAFTSFGYNLLFGNKYRKLYSDDDLLCAKFIRDARMNPAMNRHLNSDIYDISTPEEVGSVVRSRGCSACCARRVYWNVNYFGVIRAIAMARAVVGHRERAVPVACWPSTIYGCSYELSIGLTTSLKTIDGNCW